MNKLYLPSALALLVGGIWLGMQRNEISTLKREETSMETRLAGIIALRKAAASPAPVVPPAPPAPATWKQLLLANAESSPDKLREQTARQLWELGQSMNGPALTAALDELPELDLPAALREWVEGAFLGALVKLDPEAVLDRAVERVDVNGIDRRMEVRSTAFRALVAKDRASASAWLDRQIAAGAFESKRLDGRSEARTQMEGALVKEMIVSNPTAAGARMAAMSEFDAHEMLRRLVDHITPETEASFVEITRKYLPDAAHLETLALAAMHKNAELSDVSSYLQRIAATPVERDACVAYAARLKMSALEDQNLVSRETVDDLRRWIGAEIPAKLEETTGTMLGEATRSHSGLAYAEAGQLAIHYHEISGRDDVLQAFLKVATTQFDAEVAHEVAAKITDPNRRAEILKKIK